MLMAIEPRSQITFKRTVLVNAKRFPILKNVNECQHLRGFDALGETSAILTR